jgi:hypothetical protein
VLTAIDEERAADLVALGHEGDEGRRRHRCVEDGLVARFVASHHGVGAEQVVAGRDQVDRDLVEAEGARGARGDRAHDSREVGTRPQKVTELNEAREESVGA